MLLNLKDKNRKCFGTLKLNCEDYITVVSSFIGVQVTDSNEPTEHVSHRHSTKLSSRIADRPATSSKTHHVSALQA